MEITTTSVIKDLQVNLDLLVINVQKNLISQICNDFPDSGLDISILCKKYIEHSYEDHKDIVPPTESHKEVPKEIVAPKEISTRCLCIKKDGKQCAKKKSSKKEHDLRFCALHNKSKPSDDKILPEEDSGKELVKPKTKSKITTVEVSPEGILHDQVQKEINTILSEPEPEKMTEPEKVPEEIVSEPTDEIVLEQDNNGYCFDSKGNVYDIETQDIIGKKNLKNGDVELFDKDDIDDINSVAVYLDDEGDYVNPDNGDIYDGDTSEKIGKKDLQTNKKTFFNK